MNLNEMRVKYAFWSCYDYADTRVLFRKLTIDEKAGIVQRIPAIIKGLSTIDDVEKLEDISFEGRMCLKYALRKVGLI